MEKQTKQTLKVLSTLALASSFALITTNTAEAKSYKPEVRYDGKDYFVKTSDPEAVGKELHFSTDGSDTPNTRVEVSIIYSFSNYKGEELNISKYYKMGESGKPFTRDTPFSIVDDDQGLYLSSDDEATINKKRENFVKSAKAGFTTVNKLNKVEKSTESTQPTGPAQPTVPAEPVQPAQPTGPAQPVQPAGPEQPVQPTGSAQPVQPAGPAQPAGPEQPVQPAGPAQPVQPAGPAQPAQPTGPAQPVQPAGPEQPVQPAGPAQPAQPAGPEKSAQPTGTEQPVQPAGPEQPAQPTEPEQPVQPAQPTGPAQPVQPAGPEKPSQPKKPALSEIVGTGEAQNNPKGGQLETTSNKDDKKVESTIKSEGKVNAKKALPNTGLQTSSYALLGSIIGLVGIMALRRKKSN